MVRAPDVARFLRNCTKIEISSLCGRSYEVVKRMIATAGSRRFESCSGTKLLYVNIFFSKNTVRTNVDLLFLERLL